MDVTCVAVGSVINTASCPEQAWLAQRAAAASGQLAALIKADGALGHQLDPLQYDAREVGPEHSDGGRLERKPYGTVVTLRCPDEAFTALHAGSSHRAGGRWRGVGPLLAALPCRGAAGTMHARTVVQYTPPSLITSCKLSGRCVVFFDF